jgi:sialic acid synthase SpsE
MSPVDELWLRIKSGEPFFIAEAGVNHLGSLDLAERLIREAAEAGAHAIKFQSYKAKNLCTKNAPRFWDWEGEIESDGSQFDSYSHLDSFGEADHAELKRMCDYYDIEFMSTPFDDEATDYLDRVGISAYKIASCDLTNHPLLRNVGSKGKIVMLSTGAGSINEIRSAVKVLREGTDKIVVMHCNLKYPTADHEINLRMIEHLRQEFPECVAGLSDHTMNLWTPAFAYSLGATVFEKHYTVDKTLGKSADHWLSVDPPEVSQIIENINLAVTLLGSREKRCTPSEERARLYARRSIVTTSEIRKGDVLTRENLSCKRPGTGMSPTMLHKVLGRVAARDIDDDQILKMDDIE